MTALTLYGLNNCDTCKKAQKALENAGHTVTFVDIRAEADLSAKLPVWLTHVPPQMLVNKRSTTWRTLPDGDKALAGSNEAETVLTEHPTLIKRPVIEMAGKVTVGWDKAVQEALL